MPTCGKSVLECLSIITQQNPFAYYLNPKKLRYAFLKVKHTAVSSCNLITKLFLLLPPNFYSETFQKNTVD